MTGDVHPLDPVADTAPLPIKRRLYVEWDGSRWAEIDPPTGDCLSVGCVDEAIENESVVRGAAEMSPTSHNS